MLRSLSSRVLGLGGTVALALLALVGLLLDASMQTRSSFGWVLHTQNVIDTIDQTMFDVREAESGQRGFLLTHDQRFVRSFTDRTADARVEVEKLMRLTADNPVQQQRAHVLSVAVDRRIALMRETLAMGQQGQFVEATALIARGRGRELMEDVIRISGQMSGEEHRLLVMRAAAAEDRLAWARRTVLIGGTFIAMLILMVSIVIVRGIRHPTRVIHDAMEALGHGDRAARVTAVIGSTEFDRLATGYNVMADRLEQAIVQQLRSDEQLHAANIELRENGAVLRERSEVIELLGGMSHRMQAARTDEELAEVIRCFAPRVLPQLPGTLYAHNNSRNLLVQIACWGGGCDAMPGFPPEDCWALRRGQSHFITEPCSDVVCAHVGDPRATFHCEPLLAGGEVIGMLHLDGVVSAENRFRLSALGETIAPAMVNHRLQRGLREQTIRDPLTGLFNRRYMEEALALEIARARRTEAPLSIAMCDVDHFKRFNDDFGHDAGDAVLQAVSAEISAFFRDGDIVCRYGGEEFTIIAPGADPGMLARRLEALRLAIAELSVRQGNRLLGSINMSFGVAAWSSDTMRDGTRLIQLADAALYRAKREGRNRVVVDLAQAA